MTEAAKLLKEIAESSRELAEMFAKQSPFGEPPTWSAAGAPPVPPVRSARWVADRLLLRLGLVRARKYDLLLNELLDGEKQMSTNALMGYFPDAVAVALFWEPDAKCIGFKFLSKRERGDYALRAQVGKQTRHVFCDLFFKKYGLSEHQGDFEPVMVPGSSEIDCFIALVNAPSVSTSPKPADARPPAPANPEPTPARPRAPKWDKSYTLIQAIEVASLCVQGLGTAYAAERGPVSLKQAHEIRHLWGTPEGVADLKERLERTR